MNIKHPFTVLLLAIAAPAWAQSTAPSLNLQLPMEATTPVKNKAASEVTAKSDPVAATPPATPTALAMPAPYQETYGARRDAAERGCDDATYTQPEVHGSVGMGVAAGSHFSGNYQTATIRADKALGSCGDPKGEVGASITVSKGNFNRRGFRP
jgi:hypothetical protein